MVDNAAFSQGAAAGVALHGAVSGAITGNAIADNAAYGITCDSADVTLATCDNAMSGNVPAALYEDGGCVLGCAVQ